MLIIISDIGSMRIIARFCGCGDTCCSIIYDTTQRDTRDTTPDIQLLVVLIVERPLCWLYTTKATEPRTVSLAWLSFFLFCFMYCIIQYILCCLCFFDRQSIETWSTTIPPTTTIETKTISIVNNDHEIKSIVFEYEWIGLYLP